MLALFLLLLAASPKPGHVITLTASASGGAVGQVSRCLVVANPAFAGRRYYMPCPARTWIDKQGVTRQWIDKAAAGVSCVRLVWVGQSFITVEGIVTDTGTVVVHGVEIGSWRGDK